MLPVLWVSQTLLPWARAKPVTQLPTDGPVTGPFTSKDAEAQGTKCSTLNVKGRAGTRTQTLVPKVLHSLPSLTAGHAPDLCLGRSPRPKLEDPRDRPITLWWYLRLGLSSPARGHSGFAGP